MFDTMTYLSSAEALLQAQKIYKNDPQILWYPVGPLQRHLINTIKKYPSLKKPKLLKRFLVSFASQNYSSFINLLKENAIEPIPPDWTGDNTAFGVAGKLRIDWTWLGGGITGPEISVPGFTNAFQLEIDRFTGAFLITTNSPNHVINIKTKEGIELFFTHIDKPMSALELMDTVFAPCYITRGNLEEYDSIILPEVSVKETKLNILNGMRLGEYSIVWSAIETSWEMSKDGGHPSDTNTPTFDKYGKRPYVLEPPFAVIQKFYDYPIPLFVGSVDKPVKP